MFFSEALQHFINIAMTYDIKIIDNFLEDNEFNKLSEIMLSPKFPWFYIDTVSLPAVDGSLVIDPLAVETAGLNHSIFDREWNVTSFSYEYLLPLFAKIEEDFGYTKDHLYRARSSLKWPKVGYTKDNYNLPHVDYFFPHETMIYYINDSDGNTRIFDQEFTRTHTDMGIGPENFTIKQQVEPKANRLVWINGFQYHTASNPINSDKRVIINLNWKPL
jgi:hypothetical protein